MQTIKTDEARSLAKIFTPSNFRRIVRNQDANFTASMLERCFISHKTSSTYINALHDLYDLLQTNYKSEYFYKNALLNKELLEKYSLKTTTVLDEFKIGSSIADFILLNGEIKLFEIKTDLDDLNKLEKQINDYIQFANKVYIVTSSKYLDKIVSNYNDSTVGVVELTVKNTIREIKKADNNACFLNHITIFKTLRQSEYLQIIKTYFGFIPNVPNTRIFRECLLMAELIDISTFQSMARDILKKRKLKCPDLLLSKETPYELKHICYTLDLSIAEYQTLFEFLSQEV